MQITVHYHALCPFSKQFIVLLSELGLKYNIIKEDYWLKNPAFVRLSPWLELPVIIIDETIVTGIYPCLEYLIDLKKDSHLFGNDPQILVCIRQIINWFNQHCYYEVVKNIINEKLIKPDLKKEYTDSNILRASKTALHKHMMQLNAIISTQQYIVSESITYADISAASHFAVLDYFNEINWQNYPKIKDWYCLIKSRPSFRATLYEKVKGINPPKHYLELDF